MSSNDALARSKRLDKIRRLEDKISDLESELEGLQEEMEEDGGCPSCGGPIKSDEDLCCWGCLLDTNRLLAQRTPEQIACGHARNLAFVERVKALLDVKYRDANWHYSLGREAVEAALSKCYFPL